VYTIIKVDIAHFQHIANTHYSIKRLELYRPFYAIAIGERFLPLWFNKKLRPSQETAIILEKFHMKTETYTPAQLGKLMKTLAEHGVTTEHFQTVMGSGLVSDIFAPGAKIANRLAVRQALGLGALPSEPGRHVVNYGMSHDEMVTAGNYDWKDSAITAARFPVKGEGEVEYEDTLFHFDRSISSADAIKEIENADKEHPWAPAKSENLLAYGAKNPEEQRKYPIIGLGSVARVGGDRYVLCLYGGGSERDLGLLWFDGDWRAGYRFLAVRKVSRPSAR
jgi:hypothetical protein